MKIIGVIVVIVAILALAGIWMRTWYEKITFAFSFRGIGLAAFDWNTLISTGQTDAKLLLGLVINNGNSFPIRFGKVKVWLYYDNTLVAESSGNLYAQSFNLPANGSIDVQDYVNVHLNTASGKLIKEAVAKKSPKVNYTIKLTIFGVSITYSDYFTASI